MIINSLPRAHPILVFRLSALIKVTIRGEIISTIAKQSEYINILLRYSMTAFFLNYVLDLTIFLIIRYPFGRGIQAN